MEIIMTFIYSFNSTYMAIMQIDDENVPIRLIVQNKEQNMGFFAQDDHYISRNFSAFL